MRWLFYISIISFIACEKVVEVDLPSPQNLVVIEGWLTNIEQTQSVRITRSNAFDNSNPVQPITNAQVVIQSRMGDIFPFSYEEEGSYTSNVEFSGLNGVEYRLRIVIDDSVEIRSDWDEMPVNVPLDNLEIGSFRDNDPNNSDRQITIFFPVITTSDPSNMDNYYRWIFLKNDDFFTEPESITIQNDRLFNGNLIPNDFRNFDYTTSDKMTVRLLSITEETHNYLSLLKSQTTTLGTSGGTTPAIVNGNLFYLGDETQLVLGYFGTTSVSERSVIVP